MSTWSPSVRFETEETPEAKTTRLHADQAKERLLRARDCYRSENRFDLVDHTENTIVAIFETKKAEVSRSYNARRESATLQSLEPTDVALSEEFRLQGQNNSARACFHLLRAMDHLELAARLADVEKLNDLGETIFESRSQWSELVRKYAMRDAMTAKEAERFFPLQGQTLRN